MSLVICLYYNYLTRAMQRWNFIFRRARDRNEEDAWDNAVYEVFGHTDLDLLPDTEADPPRPQWLKAM
jgi:hypothetical protein